MCPAPGMEAGIVEKLTGGVSHLLKSNKVETLKEDSDVHGPEDARGGHPRGQGQGRVREPRDRHRLAPHRDPGFSFADDRICDSTKALALDEVPGRVVVIGGGYIGLELGQMLAKVDEDTVVEMADDIMPSFDKDVVKLLNRKLKKSGITVHKNTAAKGWEETDDGAVVKVEGSQGSDRNPGRRHPGHRGPSPQR